MNKFFKKLDYLSSEVRFTFNKNGDTIYKTKVGGIISLLSVIFSLGFALYFLIVFLRKDTKYLITSTIHSENLNLTDSNEVPFLIRLTDKNNRPYSDPEKIYKISLKYWYGGFNSSETVQKTNDVEVEQCDINKHFSKFKDLFSEVDDINTFYCPIIRNDNQTIYGLYGNIKPFGYYHFYISMCNNDNLCYERETLENMLSNTYLEVRTVDYSINSLETNNIIQRNIRTDRHMISLSVYKRIWVYLNWVKYFSDEGLIFSSVKETGFHQFDSFKADVDLRDIWEGTIPGTFVTMTVLGTGNILEYNRKYAKFPEFLASASAFVKVITSAGFLINYLMSQNFYYIKLINSLLLEEGSIKNKNNSNQEKSIDLLKFNEKNKNNKDEIEINSNGKEPSLFSKHCIIVPSVSPNPRYKTKKIKIAWYKLIFPINLKITVKNEKQNLKDLIEIINEKLNIITILKRMEMCHKVSKEITSKSLMERNSNSINSNCKYYSHLFDKRNIGSVVGPRKQISSNINTYNIQNCQKVYSKKETNESC